MLKTLLAPVLGPGILAAAVLLGAPGSAQAEEVQMTGPLAGAPAVRNLRLYRQGRVELAPNVSFTLLDEYRRQIIFGLRANYGVFDWLSVGVWGGLTTSMLGANIDTDLTSDIQGVNETRGCRTSPPVEGQPGFIDCELTEVNLGSDFRKQVASIDWVVSPQLTAVPFRGKLGLFNSLFVDSELYVFAGPAFVGLRQRPDCAEGACTNLSTFDTAATMAVAPTFGLGFSFFFNRWMGIGTEYRALPFSWNTGGFDVAGRGEDSKYPDGAISGADSQFKFNHLLSISFNMYLPMQYKVTE